MKIERKEVSYVRKGLGVRVNITIDGDSLTREELKQAADDLASRIMCVMTDARFVHAPLSRLKVR